MKTRKLRKGGTNRVTKSKLYKAEAKCFQLKVQAKKNVPIK